MSKVKVLKNVPTGKLLTLLPPTLRTLVDIDSITLKKVNLAIFSVDNRYVATTGEVKKVTENITDLKPLIVVGGSFTSEAADLIRKVAHYFVCRDEGFWTDEKYHNSRQNKF